MLTLPLAVFGFVYLITQGRELGLASTAAMTILAASVTCFIVFIFIEARVARPMFDFRSFRIRNFSGALLGACGMNFSFWPFIIYFPIYLQSALGYSGVAAGLTVLAYTLPIVVVPPYAEKLLVRRGPGFVIPLGMFVIALGFLLMRLVATTEYASWASLLPGCVLAGLGIGLTTTSVTNTTTSALPPERAGMASGMEFSARNISLSINIAVMGLILAQGVTSWLEHTGVNPGASGMAVLADAISTGNLRAGEALGVSSGTARDALMYGIGRVMAYGSVATFVLGLMALLVFRKKANPQTSISPMASPHSPDANVPDEHEPQLCSCRPRP